jgi:uncharacterized protein (UPF0261 family)
MTSRSVAIIATLDTKEEEARFLKDWLQARGCGARLVDVGTAGDPRSPLTAPDVPRDRVVTAAGLSLPALAAFRRDEAMAAMGRGAGVILQAWLREGALSGVIGIGGHQGTAIGSLAMRTLPSGLPRVLVSTVASGNVRPFLGYSDIVIVSSVGDLLGGPNRVTRPILTRAAAMLMGMIEAGGPSAAPENEAALAGPAVAVTALGNTHAAVLRVMHHLCQRGYEVVPFHASGAGGSAMESLVQDGAFEAVIDLTPHELLGEVLGDDIYAPIRPGRLTAAGAAGIPQVVAPGGLDYFVFGAEETVPHRYRGRPTHHHNPYNTNVRATAGELHRVGEALAERLNGARGPVAFFYPLKGWSQIGREGGPLWDPQANDALRAALCRALRRDIRYIEVDARINDSQFADGVAAMAWEFLAARGLAVRSRTQAKGSGPC